MFGQNSKNTNFKTFIKYARRSPQLMGFIDIIATDMLSDGVEFTAMNKESGRNKILNARKFWAANSGIEVSQATIYDLLITGIGYNWIGKISDVQMKEFCKTSIHQLLPEVKEGVLEYKAERMMDDIKDTMPEKLTKKLRHIASSTMSKNTDEYEVLSYLQRVGVNQ